MRISKNQNNLHAKLCINSKIKMKPSNVSLYIYNEMILLYDIFYQTKLKFSESGARNYEKNESGFKRKNRKCFFGLFLLN